MCSRSSSRVAARICRSTGAFDAQIPGRWPAPCAGGGSGSVELDRGQHLWRTGDAPPHRGRDGQPGAQSHSATLSGAGGTIAASGSFDFKARTFQVDAHGSGIDISRIDWVTPAQLEAAGKLDVSVTGSGTLDDPRLEAHATLSTR